MPDGLEELVDLQLASPGVALVTLNLPQLRNAMTTELTSSWTAVMDQVAGDRSLRAVVVTGTGSAFCSGADLSWLDQGNLSDNTRIGCGTRCCPSTGRGLPRSRSRCRWWRRSTGGPWGRAPPCRPVAPVPPV